MRGKFGRPGEKAKNDTKMRYITACNASDDCLPASAHYRRESLFSWKQLCPTPLRRGGISRQYKQCTSGCTAMVHALHAMMLAHAGPAVEYIAVSNGG